MITVHLYPMLTRWYSGLILCSIACTLAGCSDEEHQINLTRSKNIAGAQVAVPKSAAQAVPDYFGEEYQEAERKLGSKAAELEVATF